RARRRADRRARAAAHRDDAPPQPAVAAPGAALAPVLGEPRADPGGRRANGARARSAPTPLRRRAALPTLDHAALPGDARDDRRRAARGDPAPRRRLPHDALRREHVRAELRRLVRVARPDRRVSDAEAAAPDAPVAARPE